MWVVKINKGGMLVEYISVNFYEFNVYIVELELKVNGNYCCCVLVGFRF